MSTVHPADADRARPGGALLPGRLRAVAGLRAGRRAQLRARAVPRRSARTRTWWAAGHLPGAGPTGFGFVLAVAFGVVAGSGWSRSLVELVLIRPLYSRTIEQVLVTVGLSLAGVALLQATWGADAAAVPAPGVDPAGDRRSAARNCPTRRCCWCSRRRPVLGAAPGFPPVHPVRPGDPGRGGEPGDGHRARHRRAQGVHAGLRDRRGRRRAGRRARRGLLRLRLARAGRLAADLRVHRGGDRRDGLGGRLRVRGGRGRPGPAVRQLLRHRRARRHLRGRAAGDRAAGPPAGHRRKGGQRHDPGCPGERRGPARGDAARARRTPPRGAGAGWPRSARWSRWSWPASCRTRRSRCPGSSTGRSTRPATCNCSPSA